MDCKQAYLRKQITDKGFDQESFTEYLSQKREEGYNLSRWSIDSLESVVQDYIDDKNMMEQTIKTIKSNDKDTQWTNNSFSSSDDTNIQNSESIIEIEVELEHKNQDELSINSSIESKDENKGIYQTVKEEDTPEVSNKCIYDEGKIDLKYQEIKVHE